VSWWMSGSQCRSRGWRQSRGPRWRVCRQQRWIAGGSSYHEQQQNTVSIHQCNSYSLDAVHGRHRSAHYISATILYTTQSPLFLSLLAVVYAPVGSVVGEVVGTVVGGIEGGCGGTVVGSTDGKAVGRIVGCFVGSAAQQEHWHAISIAA